MPKLFHALTLSKESGDFISRVFISQFSFRTTFFSLIFPHILHFMGSFHPWNLNCLKARLFLHSFFQKDCSGFREKGGREGGKRIITLLINKAVTRRTVGKSCEFCWIYLKSLEFCWIRGFWETRDGRTDPRTDGRTDGRTDKASYRVAFCN